MSAQDILTDREEFNSMLALGANLPSRAGPPPDTIRAATKLLTRAGFVVRAVSRLFATPAHPVGSGPEFVNAAVLISGKSGPEETLKALHRVESAFGRERRGSGRWAPRPLDIDLIAMDDILRPDAATHAAWRALPPDRQGSEAPEELILPHPRLQDRAFVLVPMADVAPDWRHPATGESVREMLGRLPAPEIAAIRPLR